MNLEDFSDFDGSFGSFYGHPEGALKSKTFIKRMLKEFKLNFIFFKNLLLSIPINSNKKVTSLQRPLKMKFIEMGWKSQPKYPESHYRADFGLEKNDRWIFVEVELSDIRRAVNAFYMSRVFRTGYMRLGILIAPESTSPEPKKQFYSSLKQRYNYLTPDYPLWVIGLNYP